MASYRVLGAALAVGLSCSGSAGAQTAETDDQSEIIVTAQRRAQSARDVGITITVASADAIRRQRIQEVASLPQLSPNVAVKENIPGLVPVITGLSISVLWWLFFMAFLCSAKLVQVTLKGKTLSSLLLKDNKFLSEILFIISH
jgi:hypothetical protein